MENKDVNLFKIIKLITITTFCFYSWSIKAENITVVISIDGFSQQYLSKYQPKNLIELAKKGVQSKGLIPVYPTKTFPNHVSIATGQYPVNHGIFHNRFYRADLDKFYAPGAEIADPRWLLSLPIWTLAEQHNIKTGIYFWPTSEAKINDTLPHYFVPFNDKVPNSERISQIMKWLDLPNNQKPKLILAYLSEVDTAGHFTGINSNEIKQTVLNVDEQIGRLYKKIQTLTFGVNLIILSDHGMYGLTENNEIPTESLVAKVQSKYKNDIIIVNGETQLLIYSKKNQALLDVRHELSNYQHKHPERFRILSQNNYPAAWHLIEKSLPIAPSLIVEATPPFIFNKNKIHDENQPIYKNKGTHGYEPNYAELLGIFIAIGPDFTTPLLIEKFENIHVFPLLTKLLNINPSHKLDADFAVLQPMLKNKDGHNK